MAERGRAHHVASPAAMSTKIPIVIGSGSQRPHTTVAGDGTTWKRILAAFSTARTVTIGFGHHSGRCRTRFTRSKVRPGGRRRCVGARMARLLARMRSDRRLAPS